MDDAVAYGVNMEWDPQKPASHARKHGVSLPEAVTRFARPVRLVAALRWGEARARGVPDTGVVGGAQLALRC